MLIRKACVVGARGAFGQIFCEKLRSHGITVLGVDLKRAHSPRLYSSFIQGDFGNLLKTHRDRLGGCELLIFCTPEELVVKHLAATLRLSGLRICSDICSVKSRIRRIVANLRSAQQRSISYIGVHPMFGPTKNFRGYNLCVVPMQRQRGPYAAEFLGLVRSWSAKVTVLSAQEHDNMTAWSQAAVHLSLLSYAGAAINSHIPLRKMMRTATPIQKILLSLASRTALSKNVDTNWQIQHENPFAHRAHAQVAEQLKDLVNTISGGQRVVFASRLSKIASSLVGKDAGLKALSATLVGQARSR